VARVFVAMSGGVDSSVAAALLLEQGHDVTGVTMQLWPSSDESGGCCSVAAVRDAKRVCDLLGIPHYALNYRARFETDVVDRFADEYARGRTPNPCIDCNDRVKFSDLLAKVSAQGAEYLATGHYARIVADEEGRCRLARGADPEKDQSYFLYRLTEAQAQRVLFPVGEFHKSDVRAMAARFGLPVAEKPESQEACFAENGDYAPVIAARHPQALAEGDIVDRAGHVLGRHQGLARYTIGQRKGLGIGGAAEPWFVLELDTDRNRLVVGKREELRVAQVEADSAVWHGGADEEVRAMVRYRMEARPAHASFDGQRLVVRFAQPLEAAAPGQSVVCYRGDVVIGGGVIACAS